MFTFTLEDILDPRFEEGIEKARSLGLLRLRDITTTGDEDALKAAKADYLAKFGKAFRLRRGQNEGDKLALILGCLASGVDNGATGNGAPVAGGPPITEEEAAELY